MSNPTTGTLQIGDLDRYSMTIAVAKAARMVTDEYTKEKEQAEILISNKGSDKSINSLISEELRDDRAIKTAINRINNGKYVIVDPAEDEEAE